MKEVEGVAEAVLEEGWDQDRRKRIDSPLQAVIYELHVWDFSSSLNSGIKNKATYLTFTEEKRIKIHQLVQVVIFTSQGIPFLHGGEGFLRTKHLNDNSYNAGDYCNQLKWERKSKYKETFNYYKGLINLRRNHPDFQLDDCEVIKKCIDFINSPHKALGFTIRLKENGWKDLFVFYNFNHDWVRFELAEEKISELLLTIKEPE